MTAGPDAPAVLIAALSGRALAACARRSGYRPLVADLFGDLDTRELAEASERVPGSLTRGFTQSALLASLDRLAAGRRVIGVVTGSGFENRPRLLRSVAARHVLLGNTSERCCRHQGSVPVRRDLRSGRCAAPGDPARPAVRRASGCASGRAVPAGRMSPPPRDGRGFGRGGITNAAWPASRFPPLSWRPGVPAVCWASAGNGPIRRRCIPSAMAARRGRRRSRLPERRKSATPSRAWWRRLVCAA